MPLRDRLLALVGSIGTGAWTTRRGLVVPDPEQIALGNEAVELPRATVLYADLAGSTAMVSSETWGFCADVYKSFLACASKIILAEGGVITSYDGDRVMGIWIENDQATRAAIAGLKINYAVGSLIYPMIAEKYLLWAGELRHGVGIDTSPLRAVRTGVRGSNDLVWIGRAANYAAKLAELRTVERTWMTADTLDLLADHARQGGEPRASIWTGYSWDDFNHEPIYGSSWHWPV